MSSSDRYSKILEAIEAERHHEESYFRSIASQKSTAEKVESGICWTSCLILKSYYTIAEHVEFQLERQHHKNDPHKFKVGAGCVCYALNAEKEYRGTISFIKKDKMGVIFKSDELLRDYDFMKGPITIELVYDERPYRVMKTAIQSLQKSNDPFLQLMREGIRKKEVFASSDSTRQIPDLDNLPLNDSQKQALKSAVEAQYLSIIHGPPGTGKTTTVVELCRILLRFEKRLLVCAPSNNATDLLAKELDKRQIKVVRLGNLSRISDEASHLSLSDQAALSEEWKQIKKVKIAAQEASKKASSYKRKFGDAERKERQVMYKESRELRKWARELEDRLLNRILNEAEVVCCTLIAAANKEIKDLHFDSLIIDEASQALEAESWNALLKANRLILAGDHLQLPPTIMSKEAKALGMEETLLDRMANVIEYSTMLDLQYRMNDKILSFPNAFSYEGKLKSAEAVKDRYLDGDEYPLVFIDTAGSAFYESLNEESLSRWNEGEYFIIREHILQSKENYDSESIGIISPYSAQVKYIRNQIEGDSVYRGLDIEVNSIDGFQGQEKDVIYISLVRSNDQGEIGFLAEARRINVAVTRARKKLIIIADSATLAQHKLFKELIDHIEKEGHYDSAWNYMQL